MDKIIDSMDSTLINEPVYVPPFKRDTSSDVVVKTSPTSETIVNKIVTVPMVIPMTVERPEWIPSEGERRLFKKLEQQSGKPEHVRMFIRWENHYHDELGEIRGGVSGLDEFGEIGWGGGSKHLFGWMMKILDKNN